MDRGREESASIYGLGAWAGARPVLWIRAGAALAALGYSISLCFHFFTGVATIGNRETELLCIVISSLAFAISWRRPVLAAALTILGVTLDLVVGVATVPDAQYIAPIVAPVVVLGSALFFGARGAIGAAGTAMVLYPMALAISGRYGALLERLPPLERSRLLIAELAFFATGLLTALATRTLVRVHAEADEVRRLEIRLQHMQRLQVVGQLTGEVAHDFRNILGVVQNAAALLATSDDGRARALGGDLLHCARSGQTITRQLLTLARREEPRRAALDVGEAVEGLRPLVTRLLGPRCTLSLHADRPATAMADAGEIEQVLLNLAANARDAMAGAGTVRVAVRRLTLGEATQHGSPIASPRQVVLEVQDHGMGIAPELHDRVFDPFVTTKARGEGTGLGLATVRAIAAASGGGVALESTPGMGATFRVFLPEAGASPSGPLPSA